MEIRKEDITINGGNAEWSISTSEPIGGTYMGTFTFRCVLSPLQLIEADRDYRELIGPVNPSLVDTLVDNLAFSLSQLKQRIVTAPPFWNTNLRFPGSDIKDPNVLDLVLKAAFESEFKYREELKETHKKSLYRLKETLNKRFEVEDEAKQTNQEVDAMDKELEDLPQDEPAKPTKKKKPF